MYEKLLMPKEMKLRNLRLNRGVGIAEKVMRVWCCPNPKSTVLQDFSFYR